MPIKPPTNGPGSCRVCGRGSGFSIYDIKAMERRVEHEPLTVVAASVSVHPSSLRRHMLNHAARPQIVRDVRLDEDRSALDLVDNLIEMYDDANRIRIESMTKGEFAVSLRASNTARTIASQLLTELGVTPATVQMRATEFDALLTATNRVVREHPVFAKLLAAQIDLPEVRDALNELYARQKATKEPQIA